MEQPTVPTPTPMVPLAPTTPNHEFDAPVLATPEEKFELKYDGPLYTEINIPLPRLPSPNPSRPSESSSTTSQTLSPQSPRRGRSRTLSALSSPFRRNSSASSNSKDADEWPRIRKDIVKSKEVHAMMDLTHQNKRNRRGIIDALAVVPTVLVLSAELFTPEPEGRKEGKRKDSGVGRWEDGLR